MNTTLRNTIMNKILTLSSSGHKSIIYGSIKDLKITYSDNSETVNLSRGTSNSYKADQERFELNIEKGKFIKKVLDNFACSSLNICQSSTRRKKIVIDFSSPNIAKPFHMGHLRSTIIGNYIANINKFFNNEVTKINYLGDWGTQFGLLQYGLQANNININELQNDSIKILYEAYVYANKLASTDERVRETAKKYFAEIEQGKADLGNWKAIREVTIQELERVYKRLGISFDAYQWESDYNGGVIKNFIKKLEEQNIISMDDSGKKIAKVKNRDVTVMKSDQSTLYLSRDIAALLDRYKKYNYDEMLYVVDNAQTDHFSALFDIVEKINQDCTKGCRHIKFGRIKGMSTRSGNVVFLNDILDEAKAKMFEKQQQSKNTRTSAKNDKTCDILGTTAVIINDLKQKRQKDYVFDWDKALQSEGDSGIKLQYLHCRLYSLEQNCGVPLPEHCDPKFLAEDIVGDVVVEIARFEEILLKSIEEYEACIIVSYLFRLARHVNRMFNVLRVKDVDRELAAQRLLVFHSARIVVKTALEILGAKPLDEM